jgi:hypothetical protein
VEVEPMNREWHEQHRLGTDATRAQRVAWHAEHDVVCGCRPAPPDLAEDIAALHPTDAPSTRHQDPDTLPR